MGKALKRPNPDLFCLREVQRPTPMPASPKNKKPEVAVAELWSVLRTPF